jgi:hypothetical protein
MTILVKSGEIIQAHSKGPLQQTPSFLLISGPLGPYQGNQQSVRGPLGNVMPYTVHEQVLDASCLSGLCRSKRWKQT